MIILEHPTSVKLLARRCWSCHRWWAREDRGPEQDAGCPYCEKSRVQNLQSEVKGLHWRIRAMRGAITRIKRRLSK